jgi:pimeloyl-ACP methyl ester carboxylesterase
VDRFEYEGATLVADRKGGGAHVFLLVHGIGMGRGVFGDLTAHLLRHGEVIAIDQPGYGEAPEPPRTPTMERTADHVAAYVRARVSRPVIAIGHSMGTQVVAELAARHPDVVERVVLVGPTVNPAERTALRQLMRLAQDLAIESPRVLALGTREYLRAGPNLRRKMHAMLVHRPEETYPRARVPALVLRGEHDRVVPAVWARRVTALHRDGRFRQIAGHGHETMIRDAAPAAEAIVEFTEAGR